jgi:hypothetical protein
MRRRIAEGEPSGDLLPLPLPLPVPLLRADPVVVVVVVVGPPPRAGLRFFRATCK